jgi:hypothetical protein
MRFSQMLSAGRFSVGVRAILVCALMLVPSVSRSQASSSERFAEGRYALDVARDCRAAKAALVQVDAKQRAEAGWILYMAKTEECLSNYSEALRHFRRYNELAPGQPGMLDKLGQLNYLAAKERQWQEEWGPVMADFSRRVWSFANTNESTQFAISKTAGGNYEMRTSAKTTSRDRGQLVAEFSYFRPLGRDDSDTGAAGTYYVVFSAEALSRCPISIEKYYESRGVKLGDGIPVPVDVSWHNGELWFTTKPGRGSFRLNNLEDCLIIPEPTKAWQYSANRP